VQSEVNHRGCDGSITSTGLELTNYVAELASTEDSSEGDLFLAS
jgi:hypothetical protein